MQRAILKQVKLKTNSTQLNYNLMPQIKTYHML